MDHASCVSVTHLDGSLRCYTSDSRLIDFLQNVMSQTIDEVIVPVSFSRGRLVIAWSPDTNLTREARIIRATHRQTEGENRFIDLEGSWPPLTLTNVLLADDWRACVREEIESKVGPSPGKAHKPHILLSTHALMLREGGHIHPMHWTSHLHRTRSLQCLVAVDTARLFGLGKAKKREDDVRDGRDDVLGGHALQMLRSHVAWCFDPRVCVAMKLFDAEHHTPLRAAKIVHVVFAAVGAAKGLTSVEAAWLRHEDTGMSVVLQVAMSMFLEWESIQATDGWVLVGREFDAAEIMMGTGARWKAPQP